MPTIYTIDEQGFFAGAVTLADDAPQPVGVELMPPALTGRQVARWAGVGWQVLENYPSATEITVRHITKLAFDNRFTSAELVTLEMCGIDNPAAPSAQRQMAATLRVNQRKIDRAVFIDLDRADTRAGVQMLEAAGLLGPGRALEILDAPVQPAERTS